jgi:hypothetical protein
MSDKDPTWVPRRPGAVQLDPLSGNLTLHFVRSRDIRRNGVSATAAVLADHLRDELRALLAAPVEDRTAPIPGEGAATLHCQFTTAADGSIMGGGTIDHGPLVRQGERDERAKQARIDRILERLRQLAEEEAARPQTSADARIIGVAEQLQELLCQAAATTQAASLIAIMRSPDPRWLAEEIYRHLTS